MHECCARRRQHSAGAGATDTHTGGQGPTTSSTGCRTRCGCCTAVPDPAAANPRPCCCHSEGGQPAHSPPGVGCRRRFPPPQSEAQSGLPAGGPAQPCTPTHLSMREWGLPSLASHSCSTACRRGRGIPAAQVSGLQQHRSTSRGTQAAIQGKSRSSSAGGSSVPMVAWGACVCGGAPGG